MGGNPKQDGRKGEGDVGTKGIEKRKEGSDGRIP